MFKNKRGIKNEVNILVKEETNLSIFDFLFTSFSWLSHPHPTSASTCIFHIQKAYTKKCTVYVKIFPPYVYVLQAVLSQCDMALCIL